MAIVFCRDSPAFVLDRLLSLVKGAWIANSVFFKTLSKSIYTSNMIKGGGQCGLKRKKILTPSICAFNKRGPHGRLVFTKCVLPSVNKVYYYYYYFIIDREQNSAPYYI